MVISDAVNPVLRVHGEGHPVQTLVADDTAETSGVVGLPQGLQDLGAEGTRPGLSGMLGKEGTTEGGGTAWAVTPHGARSLQSFTWTKVRRDDTGQERLIRLHVRTGGDQTGSFSCTQKPSGRNLKGSLSKKKKKCLRFFAGNDAKQGHKRIHPRPGKWGTHGKKKENSPGKRRALEKTS